MRTVIVSHHDDAPQVVIRFLSHICQMQCMTQTSWLPTVRKKAST